MKESKINCKVKHSIPIMVICDSYMFECSISKDIYKLFTYIYVYNNDKRRIPTYLLAFLLTLIVN